MAETDFDNVGADNLEMGGKEISGTEIGVLDGVVPGTAKASAAAVLGANKNLDVLALVSLRLGSGAGTAVTATAAELNKLSGSGATVASGTQHAHVADVTNSATGTELATAINAIFDALEAFGINAAS